MFAKIIVGVVAAVAVAGAGIYISLPDYDCPSKCSQNRASQTPDDAAMLSCCDFQAVTCPAQTPNEGLAACTGGMALVSAGAAKTAPHACCAEE